MRDLDVTVYIFYEVLNLLSHLYIFIYTEEKNKTLQFVNFVLLWQISTEDLRKKCLLNKKCKCFLYKKW